MKVARAREHFDALRAQVIEFDEANPYPFRPVLDPQTGEQVIEIGEPPVLPREWSGIVGEIAHNLRSALDYLVYELAIEGGGDPERDRTAFPISESEAEYLKVRGRRGQPKVSYRDQCLAGVDEKWRKKIDVLQPYSRRKSNPQATDLARLNWLSNRDKHRMAHPAYSMFETPGHVTSTENGESMSQVEIRFHPTSGDFSVQAKVDPQPRGNTEMRVYPKPKVDGRMGVTIAFGERRISLFDLRDMIRHVEGILNWFKPAFDPAATAN